MPGPKRLALIPAIWLALAAAAPAPSQFDALFECRLPHNQAAATLAKLPLIPGTTPRTRDDKTSSFYAVPPDIQIYGYPAKMLAGTLQSGADKEVLALLSVVNAPFDEVEARLLKARGASKCVFRIEEAEDRNCVIAVSDSDGWKTMLLLQNFEHGDVGISCAYSRNQE